MPVSLMEAGIREQEQAQKLIRDGKLPVGITFKDLLSHAIYDAERDEIYMTVKAVTYTFRVNRSEPRF